MLQPALLRQDEELHVTKLCPDCREEKTLDQFGTHRKRADGLQVYCKPCMYRRQRDWLDRHPEKREAYNAKIAERERRRYAESGVYREYVKATVKAWRAVNGERVKKGNRKTWLAQYGLTPELFEEKLLAQGSRCGCCSKIMQKPVIDHDHATGAVRDLLCYSCNVGIGLLGDSLEGLRRATAYLERHSNRKDFNGKAGESTLRTGGDVLQSFHSNDAVLK